MSSEEAEQDNQVSQDEDLSSESHAASLSDEPAPTKKRKKTSVSGFLAMEAYEEDEDDDEDWTPGTPMLERDEVKRLERQMLEREGSSLKTGGKQHFQKTLGEIEQRFQEGDIEDDDADDIEGYDEQEDRWYDPSINELNHLLPNANDPLLWIMKLFKGRARDVAVAICAMAARAAHEGNNSYPIISAFAPPSLPNTLYVEAYTMKDVNNGIQGLPNINRRSITVVPMEERSKIFQMGALSVALPKKGASVLFKRGLYEGDIGTVVEVDENSNSVMVKVVPRLHIDHLIAKEQGQAISQKRMPKAKNSRPQPKLLDADTIAARDGNISQIWKMGLQLRDWMRHQFDEQGYQYLIVKPSMVVMTSEHKPLSDHKQDAPLVGEKVMVISGDLRGVVGTIKYIDKNNKGGDMATLQPEKDVGLSSVDVLVSSLQRYFKEGDSVRILSGPNAGSHGLITALNLGQGDVATVYLPSAGQEVKHSLTELQQTSAVSAVASSSTDSVCPYARGDLILLSDYKVGVVNRVTSNNTMELLLTSGQEQMVPISSVRKKLVNSGSTILDRLGRSFGERSSVSIHQNGIVTKGKVEHTWNNCVFVKCTANGTHKDSIVVVDKGKIETDETGRDVTEMENNPDARNGYQKNPNMMGAPRLKRGLHFGRQIRISKGRYKGLVGNIQGQMGPKKMQVMLQTTGEQIILERGSFVLLPDRTDLEALHNI